MSSTGSYPFDEGAEKIAQTLTDAIRRVGEIRPDLVTEHEPQAHILEVYEQQQHQQPQDPAAASTRFGDYSKLVAVSGGAPGADTGLLLAASSEGIETKGYVPDGYLHKPENIERLAGFGLQELKGGKYPDKDKRNVELSDLVVAILQWDTQTGKHKHMTGKGAMQTANYATKRAYEYNDAVIERCSAPGDGKWVKKLEGDLGNQDAILLFVVDNDLQAFSRSDENITAVAQALIDLEKKKRARDDAEDYKIHLMISGPTEETCVGIQEAVERLFCSVFTTFLRVELQ